MAIPNYQRTGLDRITNIEKYAAALTDITTTGAEQIFYATTYGASFDGTGGTDNTTAIRAALAAAAAYNNGNGYAGAVVQLPQGVGKITGKLTCTGAVWLRGYGVGATQLYCHNWDSNPDPVIYLDANSAAGRVSDLTIGADSGASQAGMHGIDVETSVAPYGSGGELTLIENVFIIYVGGNGVKLAGLECRLRNVYVCRSVREGFNISGTDNFISNCTADTTGRAGFLCSTANTKFSNNKAFGCGEDGFNINAGLRNMFSSCEAQDNVQNGFASGGGGNVFAGCTADTNGWSGSAVTVGTYYGFVLQGYDAAAGCLAVNRMGIGGVLPTSYGFQGLVDGDGNQPSVSGSQAIGMRTGAVNANGGRFFVSGLHFRPRTTIASSATPSINTDQIDYLTITSQAAAITSFTTNLTGKPVDGQPLTISITDNGTSRGITWGTKFEASGTVALPTATVISTRLDVDFIYNAATAKFRCVQVA